MEQIHVRPHLSSPKPGGLMDAIRHDRFIEFLADKWPVNEKELRMRGIPDLEHTYPEPLDPSIQ